ncbi:BQ2448_1268 [Microbotryum intermedium]|uniref:BQ2448_1268 protein n=1 Tax=Microbotryum intermedium TaxID=269621 RepID=A0A238FDB9_9BASI|nr:BQ2448_1268 [Microbotryum intermedium]
MEGLCKPQLVLGLPLLSQTGSLAMTPQELLERFEQPSGERPEPPALDPRANRHLFVDAKGKTQVRVTAKYVKDLPPAVLIYKMEAGDGLFFTRTVMIESKVTVAYPEAKPRLHHPTLVHRKSGIGDGVHPPFCALTSSSCSRFFFFSVVATSSCILRFAPVASTSATTLDHVASHTSIRPGKPAPAPIASTSVMTLEEVALPTRVPPVKPTPLTIASTSAVTLDDIESELAFLTRPLRLVPHH